jgi:hypothetical protein
VGPDGSRWCLSPNDPRPRVVPPPLAQAKTGLENH